MKTIMIKSKSKTANKYTTNTEAPRNKWVLNKYKRTKKQMRTEQIKKHQRTNTCWGVLTSFSLPLISSTFSSSPSLMLTCTDIVTFVFLQNFLVYTCIWNKSSSPSKYYWYCCSSYQPEDQDEKNGDTLSFKAGKVINKSIKTRMRTERNPDKVRKVKMRILMRMMRLE